MKKIVSSLQLPGSCICIVYLEMCLHFNQDVRKLHVSNTPYTGHTILLSLLNHFSNHRNVTGMTDVAAHDSHKTALMRSRLQPPTIKLCSQTTGFNYKSGQTGSILKMLYHSFDGKVNVYRYWCVDC